MKGRAKVPDLDAAIRRHIERSAERARNWQPRIAPDRHQVQEYALERMFGVRVTPEGVP